MKHPKNTAGRPPHNPTDIDRRVVLLLASQGISQPQICGILEIDAKTLRKHYRRELDVGAARLESALALRLFSIAGGTGTTALKASVFILKSRFGWSEYAPKPRA